MLTLRTLKELIDTPKKGEKLPTPKQLRTGESPVLSCISPDTQFMELETELPCFR